MNKVLLDYDTSSGQITHNGIFIGSCLGIQPHKEPSPTTNEPTQPKSNISNIIKLKDAGFTSYEIEQMLVKELV